MKIGSVCQANLVRYKVYKGFANITIIETTMIYFFEKVIIIFFDNFTQKD